MMHTRIRALGLAAVLLVASAAAHADVKIAAVRNDLLQNSAQIKAAQAQIQAEVDKRRAVFTQLMNALHAHPPHKP